jgi:hypothetical protein
MEGSDVAELEKIRLKKDLHINRPRKAGDVVEVSEIGLGTAEHLIQTGAAARAAKDAEAKNPGLPSQEEQAAAEGRLKPEERS